MINRQVPPQWRRYIAWQVAWPMLASVATAWIVLLPPAIAVDDDRARNLRPLLLLIGIVATLGCVTKIYLDYRRSVWLARHGMIVQAHPVPRSLFQSRQTVCYDYEFQGEYHRKGWRPSVWHGTDYQSGAREIIIVCDPRKPSRSKFLWDLFPVDARPKLVAEINRGTA